MEFDDEPEPPPQSFLKRYRLAFIVTGLILAGIISVAKLASSSGSSSRRDSITLVSLPPPPPPPVMTPPPPPPQQEEQKMEQPMIKEDQPKEAPPKDEPPLGTGIKGDGGNDAFGLGSGSGTGRIGGNENGTKWGWYASQVQSCVADALRRNRKTRTADVNVKVRIWPNNDGRVNRAQLASSTGDPALDSAIRNEVLEGLQLQPPPAGMPSPIVLRLNARRPH